MTPIQLCIFARPMSRPKRALFRRLGPVLVVGGAVCAAGCEDIDGRNANRQGNAFYRDSKFIDAAVEYERALKKVDSPVIHYNLGLAYAKMFRGDDLVLVGLKEDPVCGVIPSTKPVNRRVCVKEGDRTFNTCDEKKTSPELDKFGSLVAPHWKMGSSEERTNAVCGVIAEYKATADAIGKLKAPANADVPEEWESSAKRLPTLVADVERACKGVEDARKALAEQKKAAEELKKAEEAKAAEDAKKAEAAAQKGKKGGAKAPAAGGAGSAVASGAGSAAGSAAPPAEEEKKPEKDPTPDLTVFDKAFTEVRSVFEDELVGGKLVCSVEAKCQKVDLCAIPAEAIAEHATKHLEVWVRSQPADAALEKRLDVLKAELQKEEAKPMPTEVRDQLALARGRFNDAKPEERAAIQKEIQQLSTAATRDEAKTTQLRKDIDELNRKFDTRNQMTQMWLDSGNYKGALGFWENLHKTEPKNTDYMGMLAGINAKSGEWRLALDWYNRIAEESADKDAKVNAWSSIGNIAWSKLNSKLLSPPDALEMADRGIGALQKAVELDKNPKLLRQTAAILNFRGVTHGASFAGAIDRSTAQDLLRVARVWDEEAKKLQGAPASGGAAPAPAAPAPAPAEKPAPTPPTTPAPKAGG